jgi:hypothetical protein
VPCEICGATLAVDEKRRSHIGVHMLQTPHKERLSTCGFCGEDSSVPSASATGQVEARRCSTCFVKTSRAPCEKDAGHCCNCPLRCPNKGCKAVVWKYALLAHWEKEHAGQEWAKADEAWFVLGDKERR